MHLSIDIIVISFDVQNFHSNSCKFCNINYIIFTVFDLYDALVMYDTVLEL